MIEGETCHRVTLNKINIHNTSCVLTCESLLLVSDKSCAENQSTHSKSIFFSPENRVVYEIMWKNIVQPDRPQMTIWRMRIACWITKATNIHSEYVMLIFFHFNNGCMDAIGYVAHTLSVLLYFALFSVSEVLVVET